MSNRTSPLIKNPFVVPLQIVGFAPSPPLPSTPLHSLSLSHAPALAHCMEGKGYITHSHTGCGIQVGLPLVCKWGGVPGRRSVGLLPSMAGSSSLTPHPQPQDRSWRQSPEKQRAHTPP
eukprot:Sspe_Gene.50390::Locus_27995_Transcript_1_1_Confidence_1.000_Length_515::g.50390::m.50390